MEKIISLLNSIPGVAAWKVKSIEEQTKELYFVGKNLETNRSAETLSKKVTVYIDQDGKRGASEFSVYDYMTEEELTEKIKENMYAASFAMNPYYDLPKPSADEETKPSADEETKPSADEETKPESGAADSTEVKADLDEKTKPDAGEDTIPTADAKDAAGRTESAMENPECAAESPECIADKTEINADVSEDNIDGMALLEKLAEAVFAADVIPHGSLNATEFFYRQIHERILNSNGVDVSSYSCKGDIEIVPSWEEDGEEAEVYRMIHFDPADPGDIAHQVAEELQMAGDRFHADDLKNLPDDILSDMAQGRIKVIVQDGESAEILDYFCKDLDYRICYEKGNLFELGDKVQGEKVTGSLLNMKAVPYYPGALESRPFDSDGTLLKETELVKGGIAVGRYGKSRFGQYLGVKDPAGDLPIMLVEEGTKSFKEMQQEPYLRCAKFSGIQVDPDTGYFGGEVRLGYYFDGEKEIPVTGFSISGDMKQAGGSMIYSSDTVTLRRYHGPKYLEIKGMIIN